MTLDKRIENEISELITSGKIAAAQKLCSVIKSDSELSSLSFQGLPSFYFGNRGAETVMVNLNPGESVIENEKKWKGEQGKVGKRELLPDIPTPGEIEKFISQYHKDQKEFAKHGYKTDSFDVKQAAFLAPWKNNGIAGLPNNPVWSNKDVQSVAAQSVVLNKLQLELLPYASAKFDLDPKGDIKLLFPYIETLLDEICAKDRTYVIFASSKFEYLFKQYNKITCTDTFTFGELYNPEPSLKQIHDGTEGKLRIRCRVIWIHYQGKKQQALIAHTFPSQGLGRAYDLMQTYGKLCYEQWCHHVK